jgi:hypothetical protein
MSSQNDGRPPRRFVIQLGWIRFGQSVLSFAGSEPSFHSLAIFVGMYGLTRVGILTLGPHNVGPVNPTSAAWIGYTICLIFSFIAGAIIKNQWSALSARAFSAGIGLAGQLLSVIHSGGTLAPPVVVVVVIVIIHLTGVTLPRCTPAPDNDDRTGLDRAA